MGNPVLARERWLVAAPREEAALYGLKAEAWALDWTTIRQRMARAQHDRVLLSLSQGLEFGTLLSQEGFSWGLRLCVAEMAQARAKFFEIPMELLLRAEDLSGFDLEDLDWADQVTLLVDFQKTSLAALAQLYNLCGEKLKVIFAYNSYSSIQQIIRELPLSPPSQYELLNPNQDPQFDPWPQLDLEALNIKPLNKSSLSYVIPVLNRRDALQLTLKNLEAQNCGREFFEVVVVDDGSTDGTGEFLRNSLQRGVDFNLKVLHWPRSGDRRMGDNQFRAGLARNLGAEVADGSLLCFLDSDILLPPDFTQVLLADSANRLRQPRRLQLKPECRAILHGQVHGGEIWSAYSPYWEQFQTQTQDWSQVKHGWKYGSSFCLSLEREKFWELGGFRTSFSSYGFEDTDLAWRAWRAGLKFELLDRDVYHLAQPISQSEYAQDSAQKERLLRKTAPNFYLHHLHPEIFNALEFYLSEAPR